MSVLGVFLILENYSIFIKVPNLSFKFLKKSRLLLRQLNFNSEIQRLRYNPCVNFNVFNVLLTDWGGKSMTKPTRARFAQHRISCQVVINAVLCRGRHYIRAKRDLNFTLRQKSDLNISI